MRNYVIGLIVLFHLIFAASCAEKQIIACPEAVVIKPPFIYLKEIEEPVLRGNNNEDLLIFALELETALRLANFDKMMLREWVERK